MELLRGEVSAAPPNLVARDFSAAAPDELWVTDVTEFRVPAGKVYLSAVVDCYDGRPAGWRIGPRPTASLANGSLLDALAARREGRAPWCTATAGPLPVAGVDRDLRGARARALDVGQRGAAPTTRPARGSSGGSRTSSSTTGTGRASRSRSSPRCWTPTCGTIAREDQALARVAEPDEYPPQRGAGRRRKVRKNVRTPKWQKCRVLKPQWVQLSPVFAKVPVLRNGDFEVCERLLILQRV